MNSSPPLPPQQGGGDSSGDQIPPRSQTTESAAQVLINAANAAEKRKRESTSEQEGGSSDALPPTSNFGLSFTLPIRPSAPVARSKPSFSSRASYPPPPPKKAPRVQRGADVEEEEATRSELEAGYEGDHEGESEAEESDGECCVVRKTSYDRQYYLRSSSSKFYQIADGRVEEPLLRGFFSSDDIQVGEDHSGEDHSIKSQGGRGQDGEEQGGEGQGEDTMDER